MIKNKKVNTLGLIQQMANKNKETVEVLENLKNERLTASISKRKQHSVPKTVRKEAESEILGNPDLFNKERQSESSHNELKKTIDLLDTDVFLDKKETFTLSLSKDCLGKYEKLANGMSYKLGVKTSRNDLIRKVLEDFIVKKYVDLTRLIDEK